MKAIDTKEIFYGDAEQGAYRFQREHSKLCANPQHHDVLIEGRSGKR